MLIVLSHHLIIILVAAVREDIQDFGFLHQIPTIQSSIPHVCIPLLFGESPSYLFFLEEAYLLSLALKNQSKKLSLFNWWVEFQWKRSPGKRGSHFNPYSDLFAPSDRSYVLTSTVCWFVMAAVLVYLSLVIGPAQMFILYGVPYLVSEKLHLVEQ